VTLGEYLKRRRAIGAVLAWISVVFIITPFAVLRFLTGLTEPIVVVAVVIVMVALWWGTYVFMSTFKCPRCKTPLHASMLFTRCPFCGLGLQDRIE
jgi:hypothetical protein